MSNVIIKEIRKDLRRNEKVLILLFNKLCIKIYKKGIEKGVNSIL